MKLSELPSLQEVDDVCEALPDITGCIQIGPSGTNIVQQLTVKLETLKEPLELQERLRLLSMSMEFS